MVPSCLLALMQTSNFQLSKQIRISERVRRNAAKCHHAIPHATGKTWFLFRERSWGLSSTPPLGAPLQGREEATGPPPNRMDASAAGCSQQRLPFPVRHILDPVLAP